MTDRTVRALITGRVQGVGYRAWTERDASRRGLDGWVRNLRDGSVEAVFRGPEGAVTDMLRACRTGPRAAAVSDVVIADADPGEAGVGGFAARETA